MKRESQRALKQERTTRNRISHWARLVGVGLPILYGMVVVGFAWLNARLMIRPNQHDICCSSPHDFGAVYESITITTPDGTHLAGWYIPSQNGAAVILLHGYRGNRTGTLVYAKMLARHGYGVLLYDQRASGESEGEALSWGWRDVADVEAVLSFLRERDDVEQGHFGILGCSTGAEIALGAGAQFTEIGAVIADAPYYTTISDTLPPFGFKDFIGWPVYPLLLTFMEQYSQTSATMSLREAATRIQPRPLLLIAAGQNDYEQWRAHQYYEAAGEPKSYWVAEGATHCAGPFVQPEAYEAQIVGFFDQALLGK